MRGSRKLRKRHSRRSLDPFRTHIPFEAGFDPTEAGLMAEGVDAAPVLLKLKRGILKSGVAVDTAVVVAGVGAVADDVDVDVEVAKEGTGNLGKVGSLDDREEDRGREEEEVVA
jgi:hypothetical protein